MKKIIIFALSIAFLVSACAPQAVSAPTPLPATATAAACGYTHARPSNTHPGRAGTRVYTLHQYSLWVQLCLSLQLVRSG